MTEFLELCRQLASIAIPVFVITSMLNVGLTQRPSKILQHLSNWHFLVRMLLVNLVIVPALMLAAVTVVDLVPAYEVGLLVFSMAAGAPFLIKLTLTSEHDLALGATVMMVLMVGTVVVLPVGLPLLVEGVQVDTGAIVRSLLLQLLAPMVAGMLLREFLANLVAPVQPWVARVSNIALYVVIVATLLGYLPQMRDPALWVAVAAGMVVLLLAFFVGYMMGDGRDHLQDVGGLGTAQRGTAAALLVGAQNFADPRVLLVITIVNTLGIVMLVAIAKVLSRDNHLTLVPPAADPPGVADRRPPRSAAGAGDVTYGA